MEVSLSHFVRASTTPPHATQKSNVEHFTSSQRANLRDLRIPEKANFGRAAFKGCSVPPIMASNLSTPPPLSAQICYKVALKTNISHKKVDTVWSIHGQSTMEQPRSRARIVASLDSDAGKADGARRALEQAFQGKNSLAKKWEEEIRKRELSGGDGTSGGGSGGGGGGGSWGGGGGGDEEEMGEGFGQDEPWDWEEFGQTVMATVGLLTLYISITHGPKQILKKFKLLFRYIRQGFRLRKIPDEYLTAEGSGIPSDDEEVDEDEEDEDEDGDQAAVEFIRERQVVVREANVQKDDASDEETEEDNDDVPTPPTQQSRRGDVLSKRQAEQKEKLLQLLTPKELRQQQEEKK